ncbi:MAG: response regulator [Bacteroidota bacterium]|nr:response regulator [Bacteroidota bacterium]
MNEKERKAKLLLIEDDPISILIATELLKNSFELTIAMNAVTAFELVEAHDYDAVLMDIFLDDASMDGIVMMQKLKEKIESDNCKFFAISAYVPPNEFKKYINFGFSHFFEKPYSQEEITETIYRYLN